MRKKADGSKYVVFLKVLVRTLYDLQTMRVQLGGRISGKGKVKITLDAGIKERLKTYYAEIYATEKRILKDVSKELPHYPIWIQYLAQIKGIGPMAGGVLITEIGDILRFATVSKLWAYCGYGIKDGKAQRLQQGMKANWNTFLKAKLHLIAENLIRSKNDKYGGIYRNYKHRISNRQCSLPKERHGKGVKLDKYGCTKGHRHSMALRYMIKMFLLNLYLDWWELLGKTPRPPYQEAYLGHKHQEAEATSSLKTIKRLRAKASV